MDDADRAAPEIDRYVLEASRLRRTPGPVANGRCHYCDEIVSDEARWCSAECSADWNHEAEMNRRKGCAS